MGKAIPLNREEQALKDKLDEYNKQVWEIINGTSKAIDKKNKKVVSELYEKMAETAHELHELLTKSGHEPKHHKYMIQNRGCSPDKKEFYKHIHPVDDLLAFIENENANDDPEDITIGKKFTMRVYTRRWGHEDPYTITRTDKGWHIQFLSYSGDCDKTGNDILYKCLEHDSVCYPYQLGECMEKLWNKAANYGLNKNEVQQCIDEIGEWISNCEIKAPKLMEE